MADQQTTQKGAGSSEARDSEGTERVREVIRDSFYTMLGAASWAFEKTDEMAQSWLHQGRSSGDESRRRFDEFAARTRQAGEDFGAACPGGRAERQDATRHPGPGREPGAPGCGTDSPARGAARFRCGLTGESAGTGPHGDLTGPVRRPAAHR